MKKNNIVLVSNVPAPFFILYLLLIMILLIFYSLSRHNPFISTYEFIVMVKSSRLAVFSIFNVIIITIIFFGSFKPFNKDFDCYNIPASNHHDFNEAKQHDDDDQDYSDIDDEDYSHDSEGYDEDDDDDSSSDDDDDDWLFTSEEKDSADLQRRSDEFIAKVNERWREESRNEKRPCMVADSTEILISSSSS